MDSLFTTVDGLSDDLNRIESEVRSTGCGFANLMSEVDLFV